MNDGLFVVSESHKKSRVYHSIAIHDERDDKDFIMTHCGLQAYRKAQLELQAKRGAWCVRGIPVGYKMCRRCAMCVQPTN
jgi:hypothetical protein